MSDLYIETSYICSESLSPFSLNKLCDYISEKIVEEHCKKDKMYLVKCDVIIIKQTIYIIGEIVSMLDIDLLKLVNELINKEKIFKNSFNLSEYKIVININKTKEINEIDTYENDFSIVTGFSINESPEFMPISYSISQKK